MSGLFYLFLVCLMDLSYAMNKCNLTLSNMDQNLNNEQFQSPLRGSIRCLPAETEFVLNYRVFGERYLEDKNFFKIFKNYLDVILNHWTNTSLVSQLEKYSEEGKSLRTFKISIPILLGLQLAGMIQMSFLIVKFFLLKWAALTNIALLISGFILAKDIYYRGFAIFGKGRYDSLIPNEVPNNRYENTDVDLSGYGYDRYQNGHIIPEYVKGENK